MSAIRVVTDSTADLPMVLVEEYNIAVVPLRVHFKDETYRDGIDLTPSQFIRKIKESEVLPTTSQPTPLEFVKTYEDLAAQGVKEIISIHLSSKMSGTYQSALIAKSMVSNKVQIEVIDSQLASMLIGLIVLEAAKAVQQGKTMEEITLLIDKLTKKMQSFFVVDTLEYLQKGGRIGKASSLLGTLLNIKPILNVSNGEVHAYEKVRGKGKAIDRIVEIARTKIPENGKIQCAIVHSDALDSALKLREKVIKELNCSEIIISELGAVIATHTGPGTFALFFFVI